MPNCPVPNCPGAKLSWCQIVHFYYLGAKLSAFIILVPNCPLYYLGAKLSGAKLSGAKLSYNQMGDELTLFLEVFSKIEKAGGQATLSVATVGWWQNQGEA